MTLNTTQPNGSSVKILNPINASANATPASNEPFGGIHLAYEVKKLM